MFTVFLSSNCFQFCLWYEVFKIFWNIIIISIIFGPQKWKTYHIGVEFSQESIFGLWFTPSCHLSLIFSCCDSQYNHSFAFIFIQDAFYFIICTEYNQLYQTIIMSYFYLFFYIFVVGEYFFFFIISILVHFDAFFKLGKFTRFKYFTWKILSDITKQDTRCVRL